MMQNEIVIKPAKGFPFITMRDVWEYRELVYFLIWRDIKIKYKQTFFGAAWALFRPLTAMIIFTFIFNKLAGFASGNVPYVLFTMCGVVAWNLFSEGVSTASQSLLANANLVTKVYFPRIIIPLASVLSGIIDFLISCVLLVLLMAWFQFYPSAHIVLFPVFILFGVMTSFGLGLWFSSLSVKYRDIAHALPFIIQLLFWISPVGYSSDRIPPSMQLLYWMNPMTVVIEGFRFSMLDINTFQTHLVIMSVCSSCIIVLTGMVHFLKTERGFADTI